MKKIIKTFLLDKKKQTYVYKIQKRCYNKFEIYKSNITCTFGKG